MKDGKEEFLKAVEVNPDKFYRIYFGLKAAPLTLAHEEIINMLIKDIVSKYNNISLIIGVADSEWKEKFHLERMVTKYIDQHNILNQGQNVEVVSQDGWQGLYIWLNNNNLFRREQTLIVVGEDEWKHIEFNDEVWKDVDKLTRDYWIHCAKSRSENDCSASKVRDILYKDPDVSYCYIKDYISRWTYNYIKDNGLFWQLKPNYRADENVFVKNYDASKFDRPSVTVDNIIWTEQYKDLKLRKYVLLIRRKGHPYKGYWALPGGFLDVKNDKTLEEAALRELHEETSLKLDIFNTRQVKAYADIGTDPRTRIVDVVFETMVYPSTLKQAKGADDAVECAVFDVEDLPKLAFNHEQILKEFFKL